MKTLLCYFANLPSSMFFVLDNRRNRNFRMQLEVER